MQHRASSFCPDWTCSLSGSWMEGWCIVPYVITHISIRGWAHGKVVEGGRVHAKDKIIRKSILQPGSGLRNVVEADEWDMEAYNFLLWSIWWVMELQRSLYSQIVPFYGYNIGGQTVNTTFRVTWSHRRAILHHSEWPIIFRVNLQNKDDYYVFYRPRIMHLLVRNWGW